MSEGLYVPGRPIAAKVAMRPIGYRRNGTPIWPISGRADIECLGEYRFPTTDDANDTGNTLTLDESAATWGTLQAGDVVLVLVEIRQTAGTWSVTTTGGQTWVEDNDAVNTLSKALYHCVFDGTWTADPVFTSNQTAAARLLWATAWRNVDNADVWDVDPVFTTKASASSFTEATYNTNTDGAMSLMFGGTSDNNTWTVDNSFVAPSAGNIYWRSSGGTDASIVLCRKLIVSAGAVGATTITEATLGNDAGFSGHAALKPAAAGDTITAALLDVTPTLHQASLQHRFTAPLLDAAPTLHQVSIQHRLAASLLDVAPDLFSASLQHRLNAGLLDVMPNVFVASLDTGAEQLDANLLDVAPTLHQASLQERLSANLLDAVPTIHQASLRQQILAALLDVAPTIHQASLRRQIAVALLDIAPTLHQATITTATPIGPNLLDVAPTLHQAALRLRIAAALLDVSPTLHSASVQRRLTAALLDVSPTLHPAALRIEVLAGLLDISPELFQATLAGGVIIFLSEGDGALSSLHEGDAALSSSLEGRGSVTGLGG